MQKQEDHPQTDILLLPFLQTDDESEAESLLSALVCQHAEPVARAVVEYKLRVFVSNSAGSRRNHDADDVYGEVAIRLLSRLRDFRANPDSGAIRNFRGYVRAVAANACAFYLRRQYPQRASLQDKLRYLLTHRPEFALWKEDDEEWFCGLAGRRNLKTASDRSEKLQRLLGDSCSALSQMDPQRSPLPDLVAAILRYADCPVELDELVNVIAELKGIREQTLRPSSRREEEDRRGLPEPASRQAGQDAELEQRERLRRLWAEISELPPRQRFALLMNLKDEGGRDLTSLLPLTGVCSFAEIAATLNLSVERLAELMQGLPLDDATIATHLNITRQQVINLRKSARERLARRMPLG